MSHRYQKVNPRLADFVRTVLVLDDAPENNRDNPPLFTNGTPVLLCRTKQRANCISEVLQLWLRDKFGVSWQIVPEVLDDIMKDPAKAGKAAEAFMSMRKLDIASNSKH